MRGEHRKNRGGGSSTTLRGAVSALGLLLFTTFLVSAASATDLGDITDFSGPRFPRGTLEGAAGAVNYYSFTLSEARDVGLGLRQQETDADLILEDGNGVVLDSSERSGTANEWLRETLLAGTYHVRIEAQEAGVSEYVFRYGVRAADPDEVERLEEEAGQVESVLDSGTWESVSEGDTDLPNDTSTPGRVEVGGSAMGTIGTAGDQDRFAVELEAGRTYRFDLTGSPGGGGTLPDTFFRAIYDSEGRYQPDSYNDDFEGGRDSRVTFTASESGTYYARVSGDRDETGSYTLSVTDVTGQVEAVFVPGPPETELESSPGQSTPGAGGRENVSEPDGEDLPTSPSTPGEVDVGGSVTGTIERFGDTDWFGVELEAGQRYQIDVEGAPTGRGTLIDPLLVFIYDSAGNGTGTGDDNGGVGNNARLLFTPTATGTHFMSVGGSIMGTYTLSVTTPHLEGDTDLAGNASTTGLVEVDGHVARGAIFEPRPSSGNYYTFDYDWFRVELKAGKTYRIDLEPVVRSLGNGTFDHSPLLPEIVAIYYEDSAGVIDFLHHTSDRESSGIGYAARVEFTPNATGTYYISASSEGFTGGKYELTVFNITPGDDLPNDTSTPGRVAVGGEVTGSIYFDQDAEWSSQDVDWFSVELRAGKRYQIDLEGRATGRGSLYDPLLRGIFDVDGNEIPGTRDDDGGVGFNSRLTFMPDATRAYYVAASAMADYVGSYTLSVKEAN